MRQTNLNDDHEYAFVRRADPNDGDGPFEVCRICRYPAPLHDYNSGLPEGLQLEPEYYCALCANVRKQGKHSDARAITEVILNVGNTILMTMGAFGPTPIVMRGPHAADAPRDRHFALLAETRAKNAHLSESEIEREVTEAIEAVRTRRATGP